MQAAHQTPATLPVATSKLKFSTLYEQLLTRLSDRSIAIGPLTMDHSYTRLAAYRDQYAAIDAAFPTIGDYWRLIGYKPEATTFDFSQFQAFLTPQPNTPALALVDHPLCSVTKKAASAVWNRIKLTSVRQPRPDARGKLAGNPNSTWQLSPPDDYAPKMDTQEERDMHAHMAAVFSGLPYFAPDRIAATMHQLGGPDVLLNDEGTFDELAELGVDPEQMATYLYDYFKNPLSAQGLSVGAGDEMGGAEPGSSAYLDCDS